MILRFMNTWKHERDLYLLPTIRLNFIENKPHFFIAFLTFGIYNMYIDEIDGLKDYYDQL